MFRLARTAVATLLGIAAAAGVRAAGPADIFASDDEPARIVAATLSTARVVPAAGRGADVGLSLHVTDNVGVQDVVVGLVREVEPRQNSVLGPGGGFAVRTAGSAADGTWTYTFHLGPATLPGTYAVNVMPADAADNAYVSAAARFTVVAAGS